MYKKQSKSYTKYITLQDIANAINKKKGKYVALARLKKIILMLDDKIVKKMTRKEAIDFLAWGIE